MQKFYNSNKNNNKHHEKIPEQKGDHRKGLQANI